MQTRTALIALAATGSILLATGGPSDAARAADPLVPVPVGTTATLTVSGHGFGHGHGMSQYGARGAALAGTAHKDILAFYYPGTKLALLTGKIRVLITADTDHNTTVLATRGLRVTDTARSRSYRLSKSGARAWRLLNVAGHTRVQVRTDTWRAYRPGGHVALVGDGQFSSAVSRLTLRTAAGDRVYRGALRLAGGRTVNVVGLQGYLKGVVASEMPASWPANALRAQAVAARTYAARARADNASRSWHICDTTACQVYRGVGAEQAASNDAVDATIGQILTSAGKPAFTQFSSSSGGWTSAGSQPYLVAQKDKYDTAAVDPHFTWPPTPISVATLRKAYAGGTLRSIQVIEREGPVGADLGGRVVRIQLNGTSATNPQYLTGPQFRSMFGLRSTYFSVSPTQ